MNCWLAVNIRIELIKQNIFIFVGTNGMEMEQNFPATRQLISLPAVLSRHSPDMMTKTTTINTQNLSLYAFRQWQRIIVHAHNDASI